MPTNHDAIKAFANGIESFFNGQNSITDHCPQSDLSELGKIQDEGWNLGQFLYGKLIIEFQQK